MTRKVLKTIFFLVYSAVFARDAWYTFAASNARPRSIRATEPKSRSEHVHTFAGKFTGCIIMRSNLYANLFRSLTTTCARPKLPKIKA